MIGTPVRRAALTKPPRPNRCSVYRSRERLADALEALREDADELALGEQPLGVLVAGQRRAELAGQGPDERDVEDQVGAEQPQPPVRRVLVVQRHRRHQRVDRDGAGVVGDHQPAAGARHVLQAEGLDPEPLLVERPQDRQQEVVGQVGVEAELVGLVLPGDAAAQEVHGVGELVLPAGRRRRRDEGLVVVGPQRDDAGLRHPAPPADRAPGARGSAARRAPQPRRRRSPAPRAAATTPSRPAAARPPAAPSARSPPGASAVVYRGT